MTALLALALPAAGGYAITKGRAELGAALIVGGLLLAYAAGYAAGKD